jgi:hypothetical protein
MVEFFPRDRSVPEELIFNGIKIRQLRASDNELDYEAVIESGFRPKGFPREENLEQISRHEKDHDNKIDFAFTILDVEETKCYGCIFIKPLVPFLRFAFFNDRIFEHLDIAKNVPGVSFWITPTGWKMRLYESLLEELPRWFREDWPFEDWYLLGMNPTEDEIKAITKLDLKKIFLLELEAQKYILWKLI